MELEIIKSTDLPILSRKRVSLMLNSTGATPSRKDLIDMVSKKVKSKKDLIIIKHVYPQYGKPNVKIIAHVYTDRQKMEKFEHKSLLKKHEIKVAEKPAEPAKEKSE
ncbi:hypothetical protein HOD20_00235 [archaeon]|jgi:ribosomal protein S24E|nr:hypothetical protein [archaeon]MBT4350929.1 hypothetical protein [archaeon]MBT4647411.1 hypothetical protein [archaeon]MBT6821315.1 hypothetical protein [archaeon]MBT7392867.1 hypothetical protein [archaeon]